jgi:poly-gamma-glutamate system protein
MKRRNQAIGRKAWFKSILVSEYPQARFAQATKAKLLLLALVMAGLWYLAAPSQLTPEEQLLWEKVSAAQQHLWLWKQEQGIAASEESDPFNCGLIGIEWSSITTTLGDLASKRTACNPAWAVQFSRWFRELGLKQGDPVAIYSSASFPGLLLSSLAAAEAMELKPLLLVSLGASTWGANHPDAPWPVLATELRRSGFVHKRADFYTLGGDAEMGHAMAPEGQALLRKAAKESGVELLAAENLEGMIAQKKNLMEAHKPRLLVNIGGSHANLGDDPEVLKLPAGLIETADIDLAGNGLIAAAMQDNIPVIHMLNLRSLSHVTGIPYDAPPRSRAPVKPGKWWSGAGVLLFIIVVLGHRRWKLESADD